MSALELEILKTGSFPTRPEPELPAPAVLELMERHDVTPLQCIQRNSISELWQVLQVSSREPFLWKHLLPVWQDHGEILRRFASEGEVLKRVQGEFLLGLREICAGGEFPACVFEYFPGRPLDQVLRQRQQLSGEFVMWIARQTVDALCRLSEAGFIHGDLRPEHLLLDEQGRVRVTGLYVAQPVHFERTPPVGHLERELFAPQWYQPPEISERGIPAHFRQDLYQLGIVLYQCLTGKLPFDGGDRAEIQRAHRCSTPKRIRALAPHVPRVVAQFVESLLFKDPLRRPQSPGSVREELIKIELSLPGLAASA